MKSRLLIIIAIFGLIVPAFALYLPESEKQGFNFFAFVSPHAGYILVTSVLILIGTGIYPFVGFLMGRKRNQDLK